jgi:hypothetical protein
MSVELITPIALEAQMRFAIREGGKTVGAGVVTKIVELPSTVSRSTTRLGSLNRPSQVRTAEKPLWKFRVASSHSTYQTDR